MPGSDGGLDGAVGAYVWVFALATNETEYRAMTSAEMAKLGLSIADIEDLGRYEVPEADHAMRGCFDRLSDDRPVQYHNFYAYSDDAR